MFTLKQFSLLDKSTDVHQQGIITRQFYWKIKLFVYNCIPAALIPSSICPIWWHDMQLRMIQCTFLLLREHDATC